MRRRLLLAAAAAALLGSPAPARAACLERGASPAYTARVTAALASGRDPWGERLLARPGGPTFAGATGHLAPLMLARTSHGRPLTDSGVYYVPLGQGGSGVALHVADGGEILWRRATGPRLTITVGGERYGSCLARLATPRLAGGWLPILETGYRDAHGVRYRQESFAARAPHLASYVHLTADRPAPVRLGAGGGSLGGPGYARWNGRGRPVRISAAAYAAARAKLVSYWQQRLREGGQVEVPERRVNDARRALLVQNLQLGPRYSVGNPYEEYSFPETVDVAQVMAEQGFATVARGSLLGSLPRRPEPYANWKMGEKLLGSAVYYRLGHDRSYVAKATPALARYLRTLERELRPDGLLPRERYSSDIPDQVLGLHAQAVVRQGLAEMAPVWADTGHAALARRARALAAKLGRGLRRAVAASQRRLPDGSLFVPVRLLDRETPYRDVTESRPGSYWNLVAPYALASGLFPRGSPQAKGALRYLLLHGSRLLGLVRAGAYALYGEHRFPVGGTDQVYGINVARFLAQQDVPDQLVLSLYGQLAAGMTAGTFVAGEAASVAPLPGTRYRAMYLPPNSASNGAFLETLRLLLVHDSAAALELAYATPRAWLAPGKRIAVAEMPTRFGPVSYTIAAAARSVHVTLDVPSRARPPALRLRLRLPGGRHVRSVSLNGSPYARVDRRTGTIDLTGARGRVELEVAVG
ncbi:MAG TPA: hypothetical protein VFI37_02505 [Gaiellaceae bacterium]|nr:hypothetical protein [Gaiellaceae bacterium]